MTMGSASKAPKTLRAGTRAKWRAWLRTNHEKKSEIWLVFYKKHTGKKWISYDEAVEEALCYGWIDSVLRRVDDATYIQKFTPRKAGSNWSPSNKRRVKKLIGSGRMTRAGLALIEAAKKDGSWRAKTVPQQTFEMPTELTAALRTNKAAKATFEGLTPSHRKQYIAWVASAKRGETRKRRAKRALGMLEKGLPLGMA
jgi:uncharacterized protein YdeI (YjbR/CyaY-like superfamily)